MAHGEVAVAILHVCRPEITVGFGIAELSKVCKSCLQVVLPNIAITRSYDLQAAQVRPDEVDLGLCLLTLLSFYSEASHFDVESHAVDVASDNGFTQKKDAQSTLNPEARQAVADRLCAIDPISRHDIGTGSYRFTELLARLRALWMQLHTQMANAPAAAADVDALQVCTTAMAGDCVRTEPVVLFAGLKSHCLSS